VLMSQINILWHKLYAKMQVLEKSSVKKSAYFSYFSLHFTLLPCCMPSNVIDKS
jgi:hypothetical protein